MLLLLMLNEYAEFNLSNNSSFSRIIDINCSLKLCFSLISIENPDESRSKNIIVSLVMNLLIDFVDDLLNK